MLFCSYYTFCLGYTFLPTLHIFCLYFWLYYLLLAYITYFAYITYYIFWSGISASKKMLAQNITFLPIFPGLKLYIYAYNHWEVEYVANSLRTKFAERGFTEPEWTALIRKFQLQAFNFKMCKALQKGTMLVNIHTSIYSHAYMHIYISQNMHIYKCIFSIFLGVFLLSSTVVVD